MDPEPGSVTWAAGQLSGHGDGTTDGAAAAILHEELHRLAKPALRTVIPDNNVRTTDIVHKAFERLFLSPRARGTPTHWPDRSAFYAAAARTIRNILVDEARRRLALKRGGRTRATPLTEVHNPFAAPPALLIDMADELERFQQLNGRAARIIELRFFGGLSVDEVAELLDISPRTVRRDWDLARLWLYRRLHDEPTPQPPPADGKP